MLGLCAMAIQLLLQTDIGQLARDKIPGIRCHLGSTCTSSCHLIQAQHFLDQIVNQRLGVYALTMLELAAIGRAALDHKHHDAENQLVQVFVHVVRAAADTATGGQIWVIAIPAAGGCSHGRSALARLWRHRSGHTLPTLTARVLLHLALSHYWR